MTLAELREELAARGFDFLATVRRTRYVNRGYTMLCDAEPWPFLETSTSGTTPLAIADLRSIRYVVNTEANEVLTAEDDRTVRDRDPALQVTGQAESWYLENNTITTYPATPTPVEVRYVATPSLMVADTDEPVVPERYQNLIVDAAVYLAYKDTDEFDNAANLRTLWDDEVVSMREKLMDRDMQGHKTVQRTGSWLDGNA